MDQTITTIYTKRQTPKVLYLKWLFHTIFLLHHITVNMYGIFIIIKSMDNEDDLVYQLCYYTPAYATNWNFLDEEDSVKNMILYLYNSSTTLTLMFQTTFLGISVVYDTLEWVDKHDTRIGKLIKYWRDIIFSALVVPITLFVTSMFWTVFSIDRELVFPQVYDQIVPWWFNHCVHTTIVVVVAIETILVARRRPVNEKLETVLGAVVTVLYAVVYYSIYFFAHRWLYGVFGIMNWWQVCIFQCCIWASHYVFYRLQFPINRLIHGAEEDVSTVQEKDSFDHGIKTLGRLNCSHDNSPKDDGDKAQNVEAEGMTVITNGVTDLNDKENVLTVNVNGVEVSSDVMAIENGYENGSNYNNGETNGFKVDEMKRRNSNSPIFANSSWSKQYSSLRNQFEKTKL